jgi:hypothetical protein
MASARGDGHALLLPAGQLVREAARLVGQPDLRQQPLRQRQRLGARHAQHMQRAGHHVVQRRQVAEQVEALEHHADAAALPADGGVGQLVQRLALVAVADQLALDEDLAAVDGSRWLMQRSSVDLPAPDGPSSATTWPRGTSSVTSFSTASAPRCLVTCSMRIAGAFMGVQR